MDKDEVRRRALTIRDGLAKEYRAESSRRIVERVLRSEWFQKAKAVFSYASFRSEVETDGLNREVLRQGKQLFLPKTYAGTGQMRFFPVEDLGTLQKGYQGIFEPEETVAAERQVFGDDSMFSKEDVVMIMPGVAFDGNGNRMGYGGGYYDRYLARYGGRITPVLAVFEEQEHPEIPVGEWDVRPERIVTQEGERKHYHFIET